MKTTFFKSLAENDYEWLEYLKLISYLVLGYSKTECRIKCDEKLLIAIPFMVFNS